MATPKYYIGKYKGIEAMDVVLDFQRDSYNLGVAIAYLLRAGKKKNNPMVQDLEKAIVHLQREVELIKTLENAGEDNVVPKHKGNAGTTPLYTESSTGAYQEWQEQILDRESERRILGGPVRKFSTGQNRKD